MSPVRLVLDRLVTKGLLAANHAFLPSLEHDVTEQAMTAPTAERMIADIRKVLPVQPPWSCYSQSIDDIALCRLLRLEAYANNATAFVELAS